MLESANATTNFTVTDGLDGSFTINSVAGSEAPVVTDVAALATETVTFAGLCHFWPRYNPDYCANVYTADSTNTAAAAIATDLFDQVTAAIAAELRQVSLLLMMVRVNCPSRRYQVLPNLQYVRYR